MIWSMLAFIAGTWITAAYWRFRLTRMITALALVAAADRKLDLADAVVALARPLPPRTKARPRPLIRLSNGK